MADIVPCLCTQARQSFLSGCDCRYSIHRGRSCSVVCPNGSEHARPTKFSLDCPYTSTEQSSLAPTGESRIHLHNIHSFAACNSGSFIAEDFGVKVSRFDKACQSLRPNAVEQAGLSGAPMFPSPRCIVYLVLRYPCSPSNFSSCQVDDNLINRKVASSMLLRYGATVDCVHGGVEALDALEKAAYDLVLMDIQMPEVRFGGQRHHGKHWIIRAHPWASD